MTSLRQVHLFESLNVRLAWHRCSLMADGEYPRVELIDDNHAFLNLYWLLL